MDVLRGIFVSANGGVCVGIDWNSVVSVGLCVNLAVDLLLELEEFTIESLLHPTKIHNDRRKIKMRLL